MMRLPGFTAEVSLSTVEGVHPEGWLTSYAEGYRRANSIAAPSASTVVPALRCTVGEYSDPVYGQGIAIFCY
jgi:hypothetical protein